MTELELENKYSLYNKEEEELRELLVDIRTNQITVLISIMIWSGISAVFYLFFNLIAYLASDTSIPPATQTINNGQIAAVMLSIFGGLGLTVGVVAFFHFYFFKKESLWSEGTLLKRISILVKTLVESSFKKKELKTKAKERKEFFRLYELMKDESYRASYLEALKPDATLAKKIMEASK